MRIRPRGLIAVLIGLAVALAGCGGSGSTGPVTEPFASPAPPDLHAFLQLPVATPSTCPKTANGQTVGRQSPWVGRVDISVFLSPSASRLERRRLGRRVRGNPLVARVYAESQRQAFEEFQRLYTCWASVSSSQTPASLRIVLVPTTTVGARNALVARLVRMPGVDSVSCDPTLPCTSVIRSAQPTATSSW